jgi:uncharacterized protein YydD (DUF2326 family)
MIYRIGCNQQSFKDVEFSSGFNVILAERTLEATKKESRNGLGKSLLIEIIHFCLGSSPTKGKGVLHEELKDWTFSLELDLRGKRHVVYRNTSKISKVYLEGDFGNWPIQPEWDDKVGRQSLSIKDWNSILGWLLFDLPVEFSLNQSYTPTFRSLISYFVRRGRDAFSTPFEHYRKQLEWDKQVNNAFLLGLWWEYAQKLQILRDREKTLDNLKRASQSGAISQIIGTIGDLEASQVQLERQVAKERSELESFRVHPQYEEIEERANELTTYINQASNQNVMDRQLIEFYEACLRDEDVSNQTSITELYEELNVSLPNNVTKRIHEVEEFHRQVVTNRRKFLQDEISKLTTNLKERDSNSQLAQNERASLMEILQSSGSFNAFTLLQQRHGNTIAQLESVKDRINVLRRITQGKSEIKIERESLKQQALTDNDERKPIRTNAINKFNLISETLYEVPGRLSIDVESTGFRFQVEIQRAASQGFEQMKVFCYDLMLAQLWSEKQVNPNFLMHDSTLFDGVDERQTATALELAKRESETRGFQYICCLNSDTLPLRDFSKDFNISDFTRLVLKDSTPEGGLLGIRF